MAFSINYSCNYVFLIVFLIWGLGRSEAFGTFGFDVHHRYSHHVKAVFDFDGLPEKGSFDYYAAMAHRDRLLRGRRLADVVESEDFIFFGSNETYRIRSLGFLHYANVTVGTPSSWFLVALDTGSDLFWLPCDCTSPATCSQGGLSTRSGQKIDFNIYSTNISSTSTSVTCSSTFCKRRRRCSAETDACPYQVNYLSSNTSSTGVLVEDVLHLATDDNPLKVVDANITFGCGMTQTGSFLDGAAPNGLFGLGMDQVSVPSVLASKGVAANSFSMCFGPDGLGRIRFGDKGSSDQSETPFNVDEVKCPTYNISVTQIIVGGSVINLSLTAIFDSGTSFTYLTDPAYSSIAENFDNVAQEKRISPNSTVPFEYCYELSDNQTSFKYAALKLNMKGGQQFSVTSPIVIISTTGGDLIYCLGLVKSGDIDIIGQNFMTGYNVVFDREKMVLGWEASDCYGGNKTATLPINPKNNVPPPADTATPPGATIKPEARAGTRNGSPSATPALPGNYAPHFNSFTYTFFMVVSGSLLTHSLAILSL